MSQCHVLNTQTLGVTEYSLAWLDVVSHDGVLYGLTADGLVKLDAAAAVDFASYVTTGDLDVAPGMSVSFGNARLTLAADKAMTLTTTPQRDGEERAVEYLIPARSGDQARVRFVKLGKGLRGNSWRFKLGAQCDWELTGLSVEPYAVRDRRR